MKEEKVLYKIKTLDKMLIRILIKDMGEIKNVCNKPSATQHQIIEYILDHKEENIYQKDLENILNLRRATVSGVLQTMEKNHLIERINDEKDERRKKIIINQETKKLFFKNIKKLDEYEKIVKEGISNEDLEIFNKTLDIMIANIKKNTTIK